MLRSVSRTGLGTTWSVRPETMRIIRWYKMKSHSSIHGEMAGLANNFWTGMVRVPWNDVKRWKKAFSLQYLIHSTRDVQYDRYRATRDLAASGSVPLGRYGSIRGRWIGSDCLNVSPVSVEKRSC